MSPKERPRKARSFGVTVGGFSDGANAQLTTHVCDILRPWCVSLLLCAGTPLAVTADFWSVAFWGLCPIKIHYSQCPNTVSLGGDEDPMPGEEDQRCVCWRCLTTTTWRQYWVATLALASFMSAVCVCGAGCPRACR